MNITYKMPHVSTKLYGYIYVYTVRIQKIKWTEYRVKSWIDLLWNSSHAEERKQRQQVLKRVTSFLWR